MLVGYKSTINMAVVHANLLAFLLEKRGDNRARLLPKPG